MCVESISAIARLRPVCEPAPHVWWRKVVIKDIVLRYTMLGVITLFRIAQQNVRLQPGPCVLASLPIRMSFSFRFIVTLVASRRLCGPGRRRSDKRPASEYAHPLAVGTGQAPPSPGESRPALRPNAVVAI